MPPEHIKKPCGESPGCRPCIRVPCTGVGTVHSCDNQTPNLEQGHICSSAGAGELNRICLQVVQLGFDQNYGLFTSTGDGLAYPHPAARSLPGGLALLELVGLIVGKVRGGRAAASFGALDCLQER